MASGTLSSSLYVPVPGLYVPAVFLYALALQEIDHGRSRIGTQALLREKVIRLAAAGGARDSSQTEVPAPVKGRKQWEDPGALIIMVAAALGFCRVVLRTVGGA